MKTKLLLTFLLTTLLLSACSARDLATLPPDVQSDIKGVITDPSLTKDDKVEKVTDIVNGIVEDWPEIPIEDWDYEYNSELGGVAITAYKGTETRIRFPDEINGDAVVSVALACGYTSRPPSNNKRVTDVLIPNTVIEIGRSAFNNCDSLKSVTLPSGLQYIRQKAFFESGLTEITIPMGVTHIEEKAFEDCTELVSVSLPQSLVYIGVRAFTGSSKLIDITLLADAVQVGENAFGGTYWYERQPDGLIILGNVVVSYKGEIQDSTLVIPEGVVSIAGRILYYSSYGDVNITSVVFPASVTIIHNDAFNGWDLDDMTVESIWDINPYAEIAGDNWFTFYN